MGHVPPKHYQKSALPTISCGKNADILDTDMVISMRMKHANSGIHMVGQIGISIIQRGVSSLQRLCEMWCLLPESHRSRQHGGRRGMGFMVQCNPDPALGRQPWSLRLLPMTNRKEVCSRDGFSLFSTKRNVCITDIFIQYI